MSTITLQNFRVGSDLTVKVRLKDGGVAIDWSTLSGIRAVLYSDAQSSIAGRCDVTVDGEDPTLLVCRYAATKMQYLGVNRIVVSAKYMGMTKTYDKPAFTFVRWTEDQAGEEITIEDPEVTVEIDVEDVSSSILQEAVDAAFDAADRANDAAAAAEHMVDIHTGPEGKSAYEVAVEEGYTGTEEEWLASLVGPQGAQGIQGETGEAAGFGSVSAALQEDGGDPSVAVAASGTDTSKNFAFTFKNLKGDKGDKGDQGNTGSSVEYPFELVNNETTDDATKAHTAAGAKRLKDEVSQLEAKVTELDDFTEEISTEEPNYIDGKGVNYTGLFDAPGGVTTDYVPVTPGVDVTITYGGSNVENGAIVKYGADKGYVDWSSQAATTKTTPIPSNVYYIRVCFVKANLDSCSIKQNDVDIWSPVTLVPGTMVRTIEQTLTDAEKAQARTNINAASSGEISVLAGQIQTISKVITPHTGQVANYTPGKVINRYGFTDDANGAYTDYIPITPGVDVTYYTGATTIAAGSLLVYDQNKGYLDWWNMAGSEQTKNFGANAYYIRLSLYLPDVASCYARQNGVDIWTPTKADLSGVVFYDEGQTLTDLQKTQARTNIGAASNEDIQAIEDELGGIDSAISSTDYNISANSGISQFVTIPKDGCKMRILVDSSVWSSVEIHKVSADHQTIEASYDNIVPGVWYPMEKTAERPDILIYKATSTSTQKTMTVDFADPDTIEGKLDALAGADPLRVVVFGDSLTEFGGTKKKSIAQWLEDKMYCESVSLGIGGTRISQRGTPTATPSNVNEAYAVFDLPNWVKTWVDDDFTTADACNTYLAGQGDDNTKILARAKNCRPTDFDVAVIFMGTNDFTAEATMGTASSADDGTANNTLSGALKYAIKTLLTANPALRIYIFTPIVRYLSSPWTDSEFSDNKVINGIHLYDVEDVIANAARTAHVPVCKWYWTLGWNKTNFDQYFNAPDGTHPDDGYEYLAEKMAHFIGAN